MQTEWTHTPVLAAETAELLLADTQGVYVDGTLGLGGHSGYLLGRLGAEAKIFGFDLDARALAMAEKNVNDRRLITVNKSYVYAPEVMAASGVMADGILFDLGLSSYQLDDGERGFSFMREGALDMRFGSGGKTAAETVNACPVEELDRIFREYGEERNSFKAAAAIVQARRIKKIETTKELAAILERALPGAGRIHPATRVFQALRIEVNEEMGNVRKIPSVLEGVLKRGGRGAVITFHSLEDRILKNAFKEMAASGSWKLVNKKVVAPQYAEVRANPRARSAKLRVVERVL